MPKRTNLFLDRTWIRRWLPGKVVLNWRAGRQMCGHLRTRAKYKDVNGYWTLSCSGAAYGGREIKR